MLGRRSILRRSDGSGAALTVGVDGTDLAWRDAMRTGQRAVPRPGELLPAGLGEKGQRRAGLRHG